MDTKVLVLCGSGRCIGPAATTILQSAFDRHGVTGVQLTSAGLRAAAGSPWCEAMAAQLQEEPDLVVRPHRAGQVTGAMVRGADLVLVTERRFRGAARLLDTRSAPRTFTIIEAQALARALMASRAAGSLKPHDPRPNTTERRVTAPRLGTTTEQLAWLLQEMDALRGLVSLPKPRRVRHRLLSHHEVVGIDVYDVDGDRGSHRRAVTALRASLEELASCLAMVGQRAALV